MPSQAGQLHKLKKEVCAIVFIIVVLRGQSNKNHWHIYVFICYFLFIFTSSCLSLLYQHEALLENCNKTPFNFPMLFSACIDLIPKGQHHRYHTSLAAYKWTRKLLSLDVSFPRHVPISSVNVVVMHLTCHHTETGLSDCTLRDMCV